MTEYWIWLSRTLGAGAKIGDLLAYFGSPRDMYQAGSREWRLSGLLTPKQIEKLVSFSPSESSQIYKICEQNRWHIVTPSSSFYPPLLRDIPDMPAALFADGDCSVLKSRVPIAFVGTRKASDYSKNVARTLAKGVSAAGAVIVSGGALGIDSAAHEGALTAKGKTVAVLGCGLGTDYLQKNDALRREISKNGVLISEFLPFENASRKTFPIRNRIISGMSLGTVVIEAGEKSGSLITANLALSQGRNVFAIPGDITSSAYSGTNNLIRDGSIPVFSAVDILRTYELTHPELDIKKAEKIKLENIKSETPEEKRPEKKEKKQKAVKSEKAAEQKDKKPLPALTENAKKVYDVLRSGELHIDEITDRSSLTSAQTLASLTELELFGLVRLKNGRKYQIT